MRQRGVEAAEAGAAKTVDGLVVVAYDHNVARLGAEKFEQAELGDVGVLKFVDENVFVSLLEPNSLR